MFTSKRLCLVGLNINTAAAITTTKYLPGHQYMMNSVTSLLLMSAFCIPGSFSDDSESRVKRSISGDGVKLCGNQLVGMLNLICSLNFDTGHTDTRLQTYNKTIFNMFLQPSSIQHLMIIYSQCYWEEREVFTLIQTRMILAKGLCLIFKSWCACFSIK